MNNSDYILAIEASCDDTSVAIVSTDYKIISELTSSQIEHTIYGGVLPELASRLHMKNILLLVDSVVHNSQIPFNRIAAVAVSINPGLIGSLIVGLSFAKSFAWSIDKQLITVNHMLGHVFANHLEHKAIHPPFLALVVSGGHTELVLFNNETDMQVVGRTLDDSAGETFDKSAKLLGLGYPGGPVIDKLSEQGNPDFYHFPLALKQKDNYNFSFSGLKTSILQYCSAKTPEYIKEHQCDLAASIQYAIIEQLTRKTIRYAKQHHIKTILLAGGVAANRKLRNDLTLQAELINAKVYYPPIKLCMDNASMIAAAAIPKYLNHEFSNLDINAFSDKGIRFL